jgi:trehalose 6-phosphate synthase
VHYLYRSLDRIELLALYRTAEIALVTPLKDGMNLVAKEYCACSLDEDGVLILSEFAGAAAELKENALLVNPFDLEGVANAIHRGFHMPNEERRRRLAPMRAAVKERDVSWWVDNFLRAAFGHELEYFPHAEYFVPQPTSELPSTEEE